MFTGSIVALVTPMDEIGAIDRISLKKLINYHSDSGTSAILIMGTTGETSTLTHEEYGDMVKWTLEFSNGRVPVIVGTGTNSTAEAVSLTRRFNDSGVVGCLSVTPYYNRPSQEGLYQHFKAIAASSDLPQILYNVPTRTGCDILPSTVARLAEIKNIIGIKEATGNLSRVSQIQELVNADFLLLSGDDASALDFMQLGGKGVISVTANVAAKEMAQLCVLAAAGNYVDARRFNKRLMPLHKTLFIESNPIPVKWACKALGLIMTDTLRLPMTSLTEAGICVVRQALTDACLL
ncbi:4-hydroxy-tetrahydrodipicolinate synthase [Sodalis endosymbiont of Henestaris halophilus]|uniref:4-hydroxy-tetrahydrodipicolinate synthase n=1 Tax=Sodalis endosymbiont of Henestaris halophilus TaxID=1929246 RepID=UPI000BBF7CE0|nr:4-hydroxy-tetrahydrodipicolinate synthase [Sodalis endosymbiont of Henestaris halophilus]SNC59081.1 4-hydroxy-tetrahydrodipicolinate synthase [Sodalis endosymbiont of Henestaris halophilus]